MRLLPRITNILIIMTLTLLAPVFADSNWYPLIPVRQSEGNISMVATWCPVKGVRFAVSNAAGDNRLHLQLNARQLRLTTDDQQSLAVTMKRHPSFAAASQTEIQLKLRRHLWSIYVHDQLIAQFRAPFAEAGQLLWPVADLQVLQEKPRFQPVAALNLQFDFMIEEGAPNQLHPWEVQSGKWSIHSVLEDVVEQAGRNIGRVEQVPPTPEQSPNFYCVKGKGEAALLTTGHDFYDNYRYVAAVCVEENAETGLVFYYRDPANYYALTLKKFADAHGQDLIRIWRRRDGVDQELARFGVELFADQWYRPEVQVRDNQIICYFDRIELIRLAENLPAGGRIGLYADSAVDARFDDVELSSLTGLRLETVGQIRRHRLLHQGQFYSDASLWRTATADTQRFLLPPRRRQPQRLVIGAPDDRAVLFAATFEPAPAADLTAGLIAGYSGSAAAHLEFLCRRVGATQSYILRQHTADGRSVDLQAWSRPTPAGADKFRLKADATQPNRLRLYYNDELVLVHHYSGLLHGAAGLIVADNADVRIDALRYDFARTGLYREAEQNNAAYRNDPFMRHWASPEGQWTGLDGTINGDLWYKGDLFGRFQAQIPAINGSSLHVGVRDNAADSSGYVLLHQDNHLRLYAAGSELQPQNILAEAELPLIETSDGEPLVLFDCLRENHWLWVEDSDGSLLLRYRLEQPQHFGSRMFVRNLKHSRLSQSRVIRYNVNSDFFNAAPSDWLGNGGKWQIVNRFDCRPSWSHMIGESPDSLAAFWHKFEYGGDFCLEYYVGVRHGWYVGATDMNCTAMAATTAVDSGYTVSCSQWDPNLSQKYTNLYRQGSVVGRTDAYTLPRNRSGQQRLYRNPLLQGGRDMHGAWYYCKLRRIGNRVQYYFDNELILEYEDPQPLASGIMGLWTFCNSMTVANVKMAATTIAPRPLKFVQLPVVANAAAPTTAATATAIAPTPAALRITNHNLPLLACQLRFWQSHDPVGKAMLSSFDASVNALQLHNRLGAGAMPMQATLPLLPYHQLAGFRLRLQRTPTAAFNFHYRIGKLNAAAAAAPQPPTLDKDAAAYFHQISGTDFDLGQYTLVDRQQLAPVTQLSNTAWQTLTFWLPGQQRRHAEADQFRVELRGLGNFQRSTVLAGIGGAQPGAAYALADLTPIFYLPPKLAITEAEHDLIVVDPATNRELYRSRDCQDLNQWLADYSQPGENHIYLQLDSTTRADLFWIELPESPVVDLAWDPDNADTLLATPTQAWPDPRLDTLRAEIGAQALMFQRHADGRHRLRLPRRLLADLGDSAELAVDLIAGNWRQQVQLPWQLRPVPAPPLLVAVDNWRGLFVALADSELSSGILQQDLSRHQIRHTANKTFLQTRNRGADQRLHTVFTMPINLASQPVLQFSYATDDMGYISANLGNRSFVRLSEDRNSRAKAVRQAPDSLQLDSAWHNWTGIVADAITTAPLSANTLRAGYLSLGSEANPDQTGHHSFLNLANIAFGPALRSDAVFRLTPRYLNFAAEPLVIEFALGNSATVYNDLTATVRAELDWQSAAADTALQPDLSSLDTGINQLFLRARDARGLYSEVTSLPLLIDNQQPQFSSRVVATKDQKYNHRFLEITAELHGGAPWQLAQTSFTVDGKPVSLHTWGSNYTHTVASDTLQLNHLFLLRNWLDAAADGDQLVLQLDNLVNGADNRAVPLSIPVAIDYAGDKDPPSWFSASFSNWVHWSWHGEGMQQTQGLPFQARENNTMDLQFDAKVGHYLQSGSNNRTGELHVSTRRWQPAKHPYLAMRLRLPHWQSNEKGSFAIILATNQGLLHLGFRGKPGDKELSIRRETPELALNEWQTLRFSIPELLAEHAVPNIDLEKMVVEKIMFRRRDTRNRELLLIDDMTIYAASSNAEQLQNSTISWDGFDASGIKGLEIKGLAEDGTTVVWEKMQTGRRFSLADLPCAEPRAAWLVCRLLDKAGNLSTPIYIALP